jgi:long-chain acyl-CoA synthetase
MSHLLYDNLIFSKIKNLLGGRIRLLICGGAPLAQEVKYFLMAAFCCPVLEAYGTSETAGGLCSTARWDTRAGIVGGPLACLKLKLRDIPDLGYLTTDKPDPRGEVCI